MGGLRPRCPQRARQEPRPAAGRAARAGRPAGHLGAGRVRPSRDLSGRAPRLDQPWRHPGRHSVVAARPGDQGHRRGGRAAARLRGRHNAGLRAGERPGVRRAKRARLQPQPGAAGCDHGHRAGLEKSAVQGAARRRGGAVGGRGAGGRAQGAGGAAAHAPAGRDLLHPNAVPLRPGHRQAVSGAGVGGAGR